MRPSIFALCALAAAATMCAACSASTDSSGTGSSSSGGSSSGSVTPPKKGPQDDPGSSSSGGIPNNGPCTGAAGELYALSAKPLGAADAVPLCQFKGYTLLIVNTASFCGYTPQYEDLQDVHDKYKAQKFAVLGFPSQSFNQESSTDAEITTFCETFKRRDGSPLKLTFPLFTVANVNAPNEQPVFTWLKSWPGQGDPKDVQWNFEKYLVSRQGKVVKRIMTGTAPNDAEVTTAIEAELAKP